MVIQNNASVWLAVECLVSYDAETKCRRVWQAEWFFPSTEDLGLLNTLEWPWTSFTICLPRHIIHGRSTTYDDPAISPEFPQMSDRSLHKGTWGFGPSLSTAYQSATRPSRVDMSYGTDLSLSASWPRSRSSPRPSHWPSSKPEFEWRVEVEVKGVKSVLFERS